MDVSYSCFIYYCLLSSWCVSWIRSFIDFLFHNYEFVILGDPVVLPKSSLVTLVSITFLVDMVGILLITDNDANFVNYRLSVRLRGPGCQSGRWRQMCDLAGFLILVLNLVMFMLGTYNM